MKVAIIGGGIGGIALAILLHKKGFEVMVYEKEPETATRGNAFMMHSEGMAVLQQLCGGASVLQQLPGQTIDTFELKYANDAAVKYLKLAPWQCIKRSSLIHFMHGLLPQNTILFQKYFSHFVYDKGVATTAVFKDGSQAVADVFVGADGARSAVRTHLFGETPYTPVQVREVIGVAQCAEIIAQHPRKFTKYISQDKGLSFGLIPTSDTELVWFMQFDVQLLPLSDTSPQALKRFCTTLLTHFPQLVSLVLAATDFASCYVWNTTDFDLLPQFHNKNVVLIGDAAHLAVPFTSAGTTNALLDACCLAEEMVLDTADSTPSFVAYFQRRAFEVQQHTQLGRELKHKFLHPESLAIDDIQIPLIAPQSPKIAVHPVPPKVHLLYFTDPVCSTCWLIQPQLRKLKLEYGDYLEIEYCMAGLLPSWRNYHRGGISQPADAADYWSRAAATNEMPINPAVWVQNPLPSSYPPSIAFKAAQMQDADKAVIFLRRLNEMLFVEGKNIVDDTLLHKAAFDAGLDAARLLRDLDGKAQLLFESDLALANKLAVTVLPTFMFTFQNTQTIQLKGLQQYANFEAVLQQLVPNIVKKTVEKTPDYLFAVYPTLTTKEFAFLSDLPMPIAEKTLDKLHECGNIFPHVSYNGKPVWRVNAEKQSFC